VVRHRLEVYGQQTAPLIDLYEGRGLVVAIDGLGEISEVTNRIIGKLQERGISVSYPRNKGLVPAHKRV